MVNLIISLVGVIIGSLLTLAGVGVGYRIGKQEKIIQFNEEMPEPVELNIEDDFDEAESEAYHIEQTKR